MNLSTTLMNPLTRLWKPWFVYRPGQLIRRGLAGRVRHSGLCSLTTSFGVTLEANPGRVVGRSILTTGVYDLAVSEALLRLVNAADTVIDAGANIGYMSLLLSVATGPRGTLLAFEPHPELFPILSRNINSVRVGSENLTELYNSALGADAGSAWLIVPPEFHENEGLSQIATDESRSKPGFEVGMCTIDATLARRSAGLMKLDVESYEMQVLRGARCALHERRIRHIVFEEHDSAHSEVADHLESVGFTIFSLGWSMTGPVFEPLSRRPAAKPYEAPSFVATLSPEMAIARMKGRGWHALRRSAARRLSGQQ